MGYPRIVCSPLPDLRGKILTSISEVIVTGYVTETFYTLLNINIKVPTICDGLRLEVTPNLRNGLRRMRYVDRSRYLWADAVCIDQTNKAELGHQVSNMRLIYHNATKVIVWLGEDEGNLSELG